MKNYPKVKKTLRQRLQRGSEGLSKVIQNFVKVCQINIINECIIFCKEQNFKSKNSKTTIIMNDAIRSQSNSIFSQRVIFLYERHSQTL